MKTLASLLVFGLMTSMPATAESSWVYPNDSFDGALYFGRNLRSFEGITFLEIKVEGDPDGGNGDENAWNQAFNCKNKLIGAAESLSRSKREKLIMDGFNLLVKSNQSPSEIYMC